MALLTTVDVFKNFAVLTGEDTRDQLLLDMVSADVMRFIRRDVVKTTYPGAPAEGTGDGGIYDGSGTDALLLRQRPLWNDGSLAIYYDPNAYGGAATNAFAASTLLTEGKDYWVEWKDCIPGTTTQANNAGIVRRLGSIWGNRYTRQAGMLTANQRPGAGNIKVIYTAGFATVPMDLQMAVCQIAAFVRRNARKGGPIQSESLGAYSYSLFAAITAGTYPEMGTANEVLTNWRSRT